MAFVSVNSPNKKQTELIANRWQAKLKASGASIKAFAFENSRIIFIADERGYKDMVKVKEFCLLQKETKDFEWNQQVFKPTEENLQAAAAQVENPIPIGKLPPNFKLPPGVHTDF